MTYYTKPSNEAIWQVLSEAIFSLMRYRLLHNLLFNFNLEPFYHQNRHALSSSK